MTAKETVRSGLDSGRWVGSAKPLVAVTGQRDGAWYDDDGFALEVAVDRWRVRLLSDHPCETALRIRRQEEAHLARSPVGQDRPDSHPPSFQLIERLNTKALFDHYYVEGDAHLQCVRSPRIIRPVFAAQFRVVCDSGQPLHAPLRHPLHVIHLGLTLRHWPARPPYEQTAAPPLNWADDER